MEVIKQRYTATQVLTLRVKSRIGGSKKWKSLYLPITKEDAQKYGIHEGETLQFALIGRWTLEEPAKDELKDPGSL